MKKLIAYTLILIIMLSSNLSFAVTSNTETADTYSDEQSRVINMKRETDLNAMAKSLDNLGILTGTGKGYELERELTRVEGSTIVTRLSIANDHLLSDDINIPFTDVPEWARIYVNYLYQKGAVNGVSATLFGSNEKMTAQQFTTMVLRLLGYSDKNGDFIWDKSLDKALEIGMIDKENKERIEKSAVFTRGDMVLIAYNALFQQFKNNNQILLDLQATSETARGLTCLFTVDLTGEEVEEIKRPDRTWEDKFFGDDNEKFKAFEEKILNSVRAALDYYEVYYNGKKYDIDVDSIAYVHELQEMLGRDMLLIDLNVFVNDGEYSEESFLYVSYILRGNKLIPWSDEAFRSDIAEVVTMNISLDKHGYEYKNGGFGRYSEFAGDDTFDKLIGISYEGKRLESYFVPFDNGSYKIIIQDYK